MTKHDDGSVTLTAEEASVAGRALRAFLADDSDVAFKNGEVDFEAESNLLFGLPSELAGAK